MTLRPAGEFGRFFLPGPTEVRREVLEAMLGPMMGHRTPEAEALMERIQPGLRHTFRTERPVYVAASSGTGMMEMAIRNAARRRVLSLVNGAFSERFAKIAELCGLEVERLVVEWGESHTPALLEDALAGGDYDTVTICHSETSTGVLNPIAELAQIAHGHDAMVCVDAVSSLAGAPVETDAWGLDFVATGAQKALAPPGLGFAVAQEAVLERAAANPARGLYFDVLAFEKNLAKSQAPNTPAVSLLYAAAVQMEAILDEGIEARWARHRAMAERTWAWVAEQRDAGVELGVLASEGHRSPTVTCITLPHGLRGTDVCAAMRAHGYVIAPGYGKERDRMIRIGHMGDHTLPELDELLEVLEHVLEEATATHG
ncbi:MAG: aminotransferase class V-fold PLP-dependent enzyme [Gemmatimonadetes bacterium]|nr:alanine--glyoxylate aminotransferase family protein [Gemmatimonadota bacterium]NIQ56278.1 alanine--glyoxylate aminotransferase family protein [Gemmatimonadota bacterium]NIU76466.1 aminotransferase class V-fold PLP-dependent enzyme [Gammaproteobacteria bacterium]NIX45950.1 aminotransferase class V-fold PLP-dependent enzyme [Gemmatimonadota bacterium]NIY10271.1 aminotransferase class V-fold PLP-dependent enzyme [Gemmatimonadota bacterium]